MPVVRTRPGAGISAPSRSLAVTSIALAVCGAAGIAYGAVVIRRARRQTYYEPVWQDWLWYGVLPCAGYAALALAQRSSGQMDRSPSSSSRPRR